MAFHKRIFTSDYRHQIIVSSYYNIPFPIEQTSSIKEISNAILSTKSRPLQ